MPDERIFPDSNAREAPAPHVRRLVEHLFRHESAKLVSTLSRIFGIDHLDLAEDVVQESLLRALRQWSYGTPPDNPSAWITRAAKNHALDLLRREKLFKSKEGEIIAWIESDGPERSGDDIYLSSEVEDDQLRMMFTCCHPALSAESQIALTLKILCGFSVGEIARAFLTSEATITKRITRAKAYARARQIPYEIPTGDELRARLDSVLRILYLLFNEGHNTTRGDDLIRQDLCEEAVRLTRLLAAHPAGNRPATHALLALMLLHGARNRARVDLSGNILLLSEQDRSLWNREQIAEGLYHLQHSASGEEVTEYHAQAGIAACHVCAPSYEATAWPRILMFYDHLLALTPSPVIALNRAVAVAMIAGPAAGIEAIERIEGRTSLDGYYLLHAILADLNLKMGNPVAASTLYRRALDLTESTPTRAFLIKRLAACGEAGG